LQLPSERDLADVASVAPAIARTLRHLLPLLAARDAAVRVLLRAPPGAAAAGAPPAAAADGTPPGAAEDGTPPGAAAGDEGASARDTAAAASALVGLAGDVDALCLEFSFPGDPSTTLPLLPVHGVQSASVLVEDGLIVATEDAGGARPDLVLHARGLLVLPGLVDLHGDWFELLVQPRPGVGFPLDLALAQAFRGRSLIQIRLVETALLAKKDDGGQIDDESMGVSMGGAWREYGYRLALTFVQFPIYNG
jgi:hypothetical protein